MKHKQIWSIFLFYTLFVLTQGVGQYKQPNIQSSAGASFLEDYERETNGLRRKDSSPTLDTSFLEKEEELSVKLPSEASVQDFIPGREFNPAAVDVPPFQLNDEQYRFLGKARKDSLESEWKEGVAQNDEIFVNNHAELEQFSTDKEEEPSNTGISTNHNEMSNLNEDDDEKTEEIGEKSNLKNFEDFES